MSGESLSFMPPNNRHINIQDASPVCCMVSRCSGRFWRKTWSRRERLPRLEMPTSTTVASVPTVLLITTTQPKLFLHTWLRKAKTKSRQRGNQPSSLPGHCGTDPQPRRPQNTIRDAPEPCKTSDAEGARCHQKHVKAREIFMCVRCSFRFLFGRTRIEEREGSEKLRAKF